MWDERQAAGGQDAAGATDLPALWRAALLCGMRCGELLGLKWGDLDLDRGVLAGRRTLSWRKGGTWRLGQTRTASGRHSIALPGPRVAALRGQRAD